MREHSQREGHQGKSRVDITRLSWALWGEEERQGEKRGGNQVQKPGGQRYKRAGNQNAWSIQGRASGGRAVQTLGQRVQGRGQGMPVMF